MVNNFNPVCLELFFFSFYQNELCLFRKYDAPPVFHNQFRAAYLCFKDDL